MQIRGKVICGRRRGRTLGFPTANISLTILLPSGIYISTVRIQRVSYPAVSFVGNATTFGESEVFLESYILDFKRNIYGKWIKVRLLKKIRDNEKFSGAEALVLQMKQDVATAREYFRI